jgi:uncharacterized protein YjbJ (UPF0337 family)
MDAKSIKNQWSRLKPKTLALWRRLSAEDVEAIEGDRDRLVAAIGGRYGYDSSRAAKAVDEWLDSIPGVSLVAHS